MEYENTLSVPEELKDKVCLNPCFNGILKYKDGVDITLAWKAS